LKVVILAGGLGTRLRPFTFSIPKPLIPIGKKPIMEIIIDNLKKFSLKDIFLCVGYKSELIESYFGDGSKFGVNLSCIKEKKRLGTAGPLKLIKDQIKDQDFVMMNGDILTKLDFSSLIKFHKDNKASITVCTVAKEFQTKYGVLEIKNHDVISLKEKPTFKFDVSAGIYVINPEIIELIPEDTYFDVTDLMLKCISVKKRVLAYPIKEFWFAVDRIEDLDEAAKNIKKYLK
jgi:NDP-sugar pyrophosphorylase family protein